MKKQIILLVALLLLLGTPLAQADNVTVHGTTGMLEAHLVDQHTLEQVGTVEVWNTAMDINVVVKPFSDEASGEPTHASREARPNGSLHRH